MKTLYPKIKTLKDDEVPYQSPPCRSGVFGLHYFCVDLNMMENGLKKPNTVTGGHIMSDKQMLRCLKMSSCNNALLNYRSVLSVLLKVYEKENNVYIYKLIIVLL